MLSGEGCGPFQNGVNGACGLGQVQASYRVGLRDFWEFGYWGPDTGSERFGSAKPIDVRVEVLPNGP